MSVLNERFIEFRTQKVISKNVLLYFQHFCELPLTAIEAMPNPFGEYNGYKRCIAIHDKSNDKLVAEIHFHTVGGKNIPEISFYDSAMNVVHYVEFLDFYRRYVIICDSICDLRDFWGYFSMNCFIAEFEYQYYQAQLSFNKNSREKYEKEIASYNLQIAEALVRYFNMRFFNNEVPAFVLYANKCRNLESLSFCTTRLYGNSQRFGIEVPYQLVYSDQRTAVAKWILTQMLLIYGHKNELHYSSNNGIYKNKRFAQAAQKIGLVTKKHEKYGYVIDSLSMQLIDETRGFYFTKMPIYEHKNGNKITSTLKMVSSDGESVRVTKPNHVLYCLTNQPPEIVEQIDAYMQKFGIHKMQIKE